MSNRTLTLRLTFSSTRTLIVAVVAVPVDGAVCGILSPSQLLFINLVNCESNDFVVVSGNKKPANQCDYASKVVSTEHYPTVSTR